MVKNRSSAVALVLVTASIRAMADEPAPPTELPKVTVKGTRESDYVVPNASTGTDTPVMATPLNIQTVAQEVLKDQQVIRIDQAGDAVNIVAKQPQSLVLCVAAAGLPQRGKQLTAALARGGYVILMRHASSPWIPPDSAQAEPDNLKHERQLDETGRASAWAMGDALRHLRIPVGEVLSSPTYRALETVRRAQLPAPQTLQELGKAGKSMSPDAAGTRGAWLRSQVAKLPKRATNTVIITHYPNINEAFTSDSKDLDEGESLIYRPNGRGATELVGRVKIEDWPKLASLAWTGVMA